MFYIKHKGKIPHRFNTPEIRGKWKFIQKLSKALTENKARF
jgi:hypothetical protein